MTWPIVPLSEVAEVRLGRQRSPKNHQGESMRPYLRAANVTWAGLSLSDVKSMNFTDDELKTYRLEAGDILLSEASGSAGEVGKPALWTGEIADCAFQNTLIRVRAREHEPKFLLHYFRYQALAGRFVEQSRGVGIHHLGRSRLASWPTPVPPLDEQRRIVDLLEDHLSRLDAAVRLLEENRKRSASLRQAAIDRAFWMVSDSSAEKFHRELIARRGSPPVGKQKKAAASPDTESLPEKRPWPVASLEQLTDPLRTIRYGILMPKVQGGTVPYVEVKDLRNGPLDANGLRLTSAELDAQFAAARLHPGDVVIAVRGSFERSAVVPATLRGANISRDVVRLAPLPGVSPWYLHYWHQTSLCKRYLRRHARGVAVRGVNVGSLRAMPVPVLTPDAQLSVVRAIHEQEEAIKRLDHEVQVAQSRASRLRRSLLAAAFSGQLIGDLRE